MRKLASRSVVQFSMALLLIWGASGSVLSAMLCSVGLCSHGCVMTAPAPKPASPNTKDEHACCAKKAQIPPSRSYSAEKSENAGCTCQIASSSFPAQPDSAMATGFHVGPAVVAPTAAPSLPNPPSAPDSPVLCGTDSSPPWVPWHPDFGRAPPSA